MLRWKGTTLEKIKRKKKTTSLTKINGIQMCKAIDNPKTGNNTFEKLYGAASVYYNYSGDATCFNLADDSDPHGLGGWTWQVPI